MIYQRTGTIHKEVNSWSKEEIIRRALKENRFRKGMLIICSQLKKKGIVRDIIYDSTRIQWYIGLPQYIHVEFTDGTQYVANPVQIKEYRK